MALWYNVAKRTTRNTLQNPSRLVLGWRGIRPIHIVAADNLSAGETIIVTVYEPDPQQWDSDFKRRK